MLFRPFEAGIVDYEKGWMVGMTAALFFRSEIHSGMRSGVLLRLHRF